LIVLLTYLINSK